MLLLDMEIKLMLLLTLAAAGLHETGAACPDETSQMAAIFSGDPAILRVEDVSGDCECCKHKVTLATCTGACALARKRKAQALAAVLADWAGPDNRVSVVLGGSEVAPAAAPQNGAAAVTLLNLTLSGNVHYMRTERHATVSSAYPFEQHFIFRPALVQTKGGFMTMGSRTDSSVQTYATLGVGELVDEFLQGFGRVLFSDMPVQRPSYRFFSTAIAAGAKCTPANGPF
ncbi:hypothetical protein IP76_21365 [Rhizobium sp. AAP43]|nr:hypothetical protein IP76_21365 [Rhizobium sp. AAP43]